MTGIGGEPLLHNRNLTHRRDLARAPLEAGPQELLNRHRAVRFDDVKKDVLRVGPVSPDHLHAGNIRVEERIGAAVVAWARFRSVDLRDVK